MTIVRRQPETGTCALFNRTTGAENRELLVAPFKTFRLARGSSLFLSALQPSCNDIPHDFGDRYATLARDGLQFFPVALDEIKIYFLHVGKANNLSHDCHYSATIHQRLPSG